MSFSHQVASVRRGKSQYKIRRRSRTKISEASREPNGKISSGLSKPLKVGTSLHFALWGPHLPHPSPGPNMEFLQINES